MTIITLCGSTRFKKNFDEINKELSLKGNIVLSLPYFDKSEEKKLTPEQIEMLTKVHYQKIDISDEIFVLDVWVNGHGSYIGVQTQEEIDYARSKGKRVRFYSTYELGWNTIPQEILDVRKQDFHVGFECGIIHEMMYNNRIFYNFQIFTASKRYVKIMAKHFHYNCEFQEKDEQYSAFTAQPIHIKK